MSTYFGGNHYRHFWKGVAGGTMNIVCFIASQIGIQAERVVKPELVGQPLALLNDEAIAVVSGEAQALGIRRNQKHTAALALCPSLILLPYDRILYDETARHLWDSLAIESSIVEPVSPELCFVELSGRDISERVDQLIESIVEQTGLSIQVGRASSKFVAEIAAERADNNCAYTVSSVESASFISSFSSIYFS